MIYFRNIFHLLILSLFFGVLEAKVSIVVVDYYTRYKFFSENADKKREVASLTKMATAAVVIDYIESAGISKETFIRVPDSIRSINGINRLNLRVGDRLTIGDALAAAIISSDNFAAETLASFVGSEVLIRNGKRVKKPVQEFVRNMNALAERLAMDDTKFANAHGLDSKKPRGYSTADDMARLAIYVMTKAQYLFYSSQKSKKVTIFQSGEAGTFLIKNTNILLGNKKLGGDSVKIDGIKTGLTKKAGGCLALSAFKKASFYFNENGDKIIVPNRLITIVLGEEIPKTRSGEINDMKRFYTAMNVLEDSLRRYDMWVRDGRPKLGPKNYLFGKR